MSNCSRIQSALAGLLALGVMSPLLAQQAQEAGDDQAPLEVTIRPRAEPIIEGYMEDGVLATDDGRYFLYTGWYIDRLGDRLARRLYT